MCRGATHWVQGADPAAQEIGLKPVLSGVKTEDEGLYTEQHRYWQQSLRQALQKGAQQAADACDRHGDHCHHGA